MSTSLRFSALILAVYLLASPGACAQPSVELRQSFLDLSHDGVLMNISAHPDDEDGATLAYYRMKFGVKTYSVFFTRGEGGQNEKGPELYEELGVLRTEETKEAARIQGTEIRFLNLLDFGYSKTASETFKKWGGSTEVLRRLVYVIRKLKPDVIFTNHNTADGHGHHQAVAITAINAFDAAADPSFFPEQLKQEGVSLWQARKLFFRNFGRVDQSADVVNNIDEINESRGFTYFEIAVSALRMHKTQGMDRADLRRFTRGLSLYRLVRTNSLYERDSTTFFSGIELVSPESPLAATRSAISQLRVDMERGTLLNAVATVLDQITAAGSRALPAPQDERLLGRWKSELEKLAADLCGLEARLILADTVVVAGQKVPTTLQVKSGECEIANVQWHIFPPDGWSVEESAPKKAVRNRHAVDEEFILRIGNSPHPTLPRAVAQYNPIEWSQSVRFSISYSVNAQRLSFSASKECEVAPAQVLSVVPAIAKISDKGRWFTYTVKNFLPHKIAGKVTVEAPAGWSRETSSFIIKHEDGESSGKIFIRPPSSAGEGEYRLQFRTEWDSCDVIARLFAVEVGEDADVGILQSYDNTLEATCDELGVAHSLLQDDDLEKGDLSRFTSIIIDMRAYLVREDLKKHNARLLQYVGDGGNLVVMYQRDQEWKPEYAPYPFRVSRRRIADEEAPIRVLRTDHPLLNHPNQITHLAWQGWKQERAVYFPDSVSREYVSLLSCNDPDEQPLSTGYLVAKHGKGSYIYTSYVWYRQLKEAHPGAYRCFANMISYPQFRQ